MAEQKDSNIAVYPYKCFFHDCIWQEDKIVFPASSYNAICEGDINIGSVRIIGTADEEMKELLFYGIYKWKDCLILPGRNAKPGLHLFCLTNCKWDYIAVEDSRKEWMNFREEGVFERNGYLYIFPFALVVLKLDMETKSIDYIFYPDRKPEDDRRGELVRIEDMVYIPMKHGVNIYKFDLASERWMIAEVNTELKGIDTLCYDGSLFWMSGVGKMICSWNEENNAAVSYYNFPQRFCKLGEIAECANRKGEDGWWFGQSFLYGTSIYFLPNDANMMIEFDTDTKEIREVLITDEEETQESLERAGRFSTVKYMEAKQKENFLLMLSNKNKNMIVIDLATKKVKKVELSIYAQSDWDKILPYSQIMHESMANLEVWLRSVINKENQCIMQKECEKVGRKIYITD